jgi:hypothetical protein
MERSDIIAHEILAHIMAPLLPEFLAQLRNHGNQWACELASRLIAVVGDTTPETWTITLDDSSAPAVYDRLQRGIPIVTGSLLKNHRDREKSLPCMVLMIKRPRREDEEEDGLYTLPNEDFNLAVGDQVLFCSQEGVRKEIAWTLNNRNALRYIQTGEISPDGYVFRWLSRRRDRLLAQE